MDAFDNALERIDEINIDKKLIPAFNESLKLMSNYFDKLDELTTDYNQLFEEFLYNNLKITAVDKLDNAEGMFYPNENKIEIVYRENNTNFMVHVLVHEFIHFMIHNQYSSLPSWADEMMTEFTAMQIQNNDYGSYAALVDIAKYIDRNIQNISVEQFLNGHFSDVINEQGLDFFTLSLNRCEKKSYGVSQDIQNVIYHLITHKLINEVKENKDKSYREYFNEYINLIADHYRIITSEAVAIFVYLTNCYLQLRSYGFNEYKYRKIIQDNIDPLLVQKYLEKKTNFQFDFIQKFYVDNTVHYIGYNKDNICVFIHANHSPNLIQVLDIGESYNFHFSATSVGFGADCNRDKFHITINDKLFIYNDSTKKFDIDNCIEYDCSNNKLFDKVASVITDSVYRTKCDLSLMAQTTVVDSFDTSIERKLMQLNSFAGALGAEVYGTCPNTYIIGRYQEDAFIVNPVIALNKETVMNSEMIDIVNTESIKKIADNMNGGEQVILFAKTSENATVPLANIIKNIDNDDYKIAFHYDKFVDKLPKKYQDMIYQQILSKKKYDNILIK